MSNFIICRGLGGVLTVSNGYGAPSGAVVDGAVISFENGGLEIHVQKFNNGVMVVFSDGDNYFNRFFTLTADQLAGNDWMLVKVSRTVTDGVGTLFLSVGSSEIAQIDGITVKTYSGKVTIMKDKSGAVFDARILKRNIDINAVEYYLYDMTENRGKSLLPAER